ncbi:EAL domain-containing protein [Rhizobium sp. FKY42]|uniref:putative bifunctional diguanylate cyclase/phosphodiesterase n=1 Tax=Rhizobium sp. FKY42 TaxID=2562310 RepID=UPI0010C031FE|nr:EAL domain-containing protein [Rhizobium sp. FKY42]
MTDRHPLLLKQLERVTAGDTVDLPRLLSLISDAYFDHERELKRADRAHRIMSDELEEANRSLREAMCEDVQNKRFSQSLDHMPQGLALYDRSGLLIYANKQFIAHYCLPSDFNPLAKPLDEILRRSKALSGAGEQEHVRLIQECLSLPIVRSSVIEQRWPDGRTIAISRDPIEGGGYLDTQTDVSESHRARQQIAHLANYDVLTNIPNRRLFQQRLEESAEAASAGELVGILCIDLDRFKAVNDTLGHAVGDDLLLAVTRRLRNRLRKTDMIARLGGDEFAVILRDLQSKDQASKLASRLITSLSSPFSIKGYRISIGASIGIDFLEEGRSSAEAALRNADLALYESKNNGRNSHHLFQPNMHDRLTEKHRLEQELREALVKDEFTVHYQPQFDAKTGRLKGFEALVRWHSRTGKLIPPDVFIPLSEEIGLINELGEWVMRRACQDAAQWPEPVTIAVNVSPVQFHGGRLTQIVRDILKETGLDPCRLEIEVTESVTIADISSTRHVLDELRELGISISLDDFGTGYSSLSQLRNFPFSKIKIDRGFINDLGKTDDSLAIIRAVASLCGALGLVSVAEGVETDEQLQILKDEHCDIIQGYLTGRPMNLEATLALLADHFSEQNEGPRAKGQAQHAR